MPDRIVVPAADFIRNIGHWQKEALRHPISITHFGKERLVLAAPEDLEVREVTSPQSPTEGPWRAAYSLLIDNMLQGYVAFDAKLRIVVVNRVAEAFLGQSRDDLRGQSVAGAFSDVLGSILSERLQRAMRSRMPETFDIGAMGEPHLVGVTYPCGDGAIVVFANQTELHTLQHMHQEDEGLREALCAHGQITTMRLDARGRIETVGGSFAHWSGFEGEQVVGHRLYDLLVARERREFAQAFETMLRAGRPSHMSLTFLKKNGSEISGSVSLAPIMTDFVPRGAHIVWVADGFQEELQARNAAS